MERVRIGEAVARAEGQGAAAAVGAASRAAAQALAALDGTDPDLVLAWASGLAPDDAAAALAAVARGTRAHVSLGCTAHGVIGSGTAVESQPAVAVWAAVLPSARLRVFHLETLRTGDALAVMGLPPRLDDDAAVLLLADPWSFPADGFASSDGAWAGVPLLGGLAAGEAGPGQSRLLIDGRVVDRGAVGVVIGGGVLLRTLVSQGCRPVGPPMTVTAAGDGVVEALAGARALDRAREVVAGLAPHDQPLALAGLHLGVAMDEYGDDLGRGDFLVRAIRGADEGTGAIAVGDAVEVGATVRFHVRDAVGADADLADLLAASREADPSPLAGALVVSCHGRGEALFGTADHDVIAVRAGLGVDPVGGFFAAGEFGPVGGRNHLHAFSAVVLAFERHVAPVEAHR